MTWKPFEHHWSLCEGIPPVTAGGFPSHKGPVIWGFYVFHDVRHNTVLKLNKQFRCQWLIHVWRSCDVTVIVCDTDFPGSLWAKLFRRNVNMTFNIIFPHSHSTGMCNPSLWKTMTWITYIIYPMTAAAGLAMQEARASVVMVFPTVAQTILL